MIDMCLFPFDCPKFAEAGRKISLLDLELTKWVNFRRTLKDPPPKYFWQYWEGLEPKTILRLKYYLFPTSVRNQCSNPDKRFWRLIFQNNWPSLLGLLDITQSTPSMTIFGIALYLDNLNKQKKHNIVRCVQKFTAIFFFFFNIKHFSNIIFIEGFPKSLRNQATIINTLSNLIRVCKTSQQHFFFCKNRNLIFVFLKCCQCSLRTEAIMAFGIFCFFIIW